MCLDSLKKATYDKCLPLSADFHNNGNRVKVQQAFMRSENAVDILGGISSTMVPAVLDLALAINGLYYRFDPYTAMGPFTSHTKEKARAAYGRISPARALADGSYSWVLYRSPAGENYVERLLTLHGFWSQLSDPVARIVKGFGSIPSNFVELEKLVTLLEQKPTIANCVDAKAMELRQGDIEFTVTLESLRVEFGIASQEPQLFDGSIKENVKYARLEASGAEVIEAYRRAHLEYSSFTRKSANVISKSQAGSGSASHLRVCF
ncbi:ABC transporter ATP-binding protein [Blastomyces parvus]|uniref:ABC transporter ATP-binding protein n=1 Tax=Blastomyces parvus TaxID=2060905 RepID=A0A2B7WGW9_9EURO|nr:ABC transporter ATP-binding protein [Blastomyces parvus]